LSAGGSRQRECEQSERQQAAVQHGGKNTAESARRGRLSQAPAGGVL
jgi:hypothetical protein